MLIKMALISLLLHSQAFARRSICVWKREVRSRGRKPIYSAKIGTRAILWTMHIIIIYYLLVRIYI